MNPLHLIWIIPVSGVIGYAAAVLMTAAAKQEERSEQR